MSSRVSIHLILIRFAYAVVDHGTSHMLELAQLAEKDPEFYKYLQENDRELLEFTATQEGRDEIDDDDEDDVMDGDDNEEEDMGEELPILTTSILKTWQKALLEVNYISFFHYTCTADLVAIASFTASPPQTARCISLRSAYE
jgi:hypothetical protein